MPTNCYIQQTTGFEFDIDIQTFMFQVLEKLCVKNMSKLIFLTSLIIHSSKCVWVADVSHTISVLYKDGEFEVLPGLNYYASVVAWASFTNEQLTNGWMNLEITTNEHFPDEIQAQAAGFAEGYLTKESIYNYYQGNFFFHFY